ncbi:MAG: hypothetical protein AAF465_08900 [Pseudomonadota bacterium]
MASTAAAQAAVPDGISYQAYLTDSTGSPITSDVSITFAAYNVDTGGVPLWSQTQLVSPDNGLFSVVLGNPVNPFPAGLFDTPIYVGLFVAGEEMLPRRALNTSAYAFKSADADTLTGATAADLDQSSDIASINTSVGDLQSDVSSVQTGLSTVQSDVAVASGDIVTNQVAINNNNADINANTASIAALQAVGADITSVSVGAGLIGGSLSGNASVAIAPGGVTNGLLGDNAVTGPKIADDAVGPDELDSSGNYAVNGMTVNGATSLEGQVDFDSAFDINIYDDFNGFRWRSADGSQQFASIEVRENDTKFRDVARGRIIFESDTNGIGIGTGIPVSTHAVTIPSLAVTGNVDIGLERVSQSYPLDSMSVSCHSHGNLPCYYGLVTVSCPVGKKLLGGGSSGSSGLFGSVSIAAPITDSAFQCGASYDIANSTRNCFAICARVD